MEQEEPRGGPLPGVDEQSGRRQNRKGDGGRQCLATANFLLHWRVAGAIAGLETEVMFSDLGSKKIHWIPRVREDGGEKENVSTHTCAHTCTRCATAQDPGS